jgi:hypothetical protein
MRTLCSTAARWRRGWREEGEGENEEEEEENEEGGEEEEELRPGGRVG